MLTRSRKKISNESASDIDHKNQSRDKPNKGNREKHKIEFSPDKGAKRRNPARINESIDMKMKTSPDGESSNRSIDDCELETCYNAIKEVLTSKYTNVVDRLNLSFPAKCTRALMECSQNHSKKFSIPMSDNITASQTFLNNYQPLMYIHVISMDVLQNKFPGCSAIQSLFELILGVTDPLNDEYDVTSVIDMAAITIGNIMQKFPPCWPGANAEYRVLITAKQKNFLTDSHELLNNRTLFGDIIHCLESAIQPVAKSSAVLAKLEDTFNDSILNDSHLLTFQQWESKQTKKFSFDKLKRDDKIERLFLSLSLFVQLFEADLAMWTIKNNKNPSEKIGNHDKNPLIALILWENEPPQVNYYIKEILKLYVNYISINFPREHTKTLGRLVNLIYNIFELREIRLNKSKIEYPSSTENQSRFCDSFTKIIFDIIGCNIHLWLDVIGVIEHPRLKLYLVTALLTKIDHKNGTLMPKTIFSTLNKMEREFNDDEYNGSIGENNNVVDKSKRTTINVPKYPYLQKVPHRANTGELTARTQIELHLVALNAYLNVFHIKEFRNYWQNFAHLEQQKAINLKNYEEDTESFTSERAKPFNLKQMDKLQQKPFDTRIKAIEQNGYSLDVISEALVISKSIELYVDVKKYRDDLKFVDMIRNGLPKLHEHFDQLFQKLN